MPTSEQLANRETWRNALLSGDYEQCNGALRTRSGDGVYSYCCLGVALDVILGSDGWKTATSGRYVHADEKESLGTMRNDVFEALFDFGPSEIRPLGTPIMSDDDSQGHFIDANDNHKATFTQIAAMIPQQVSA